MPKKITLTFEVPDDASDIVIRHGCAVISGWSEDGGTPILRTLYLEDTPSWISRALFESGAEMDNINFRGSIGAAE